jgi:hypothetical protein
VVASWADLDLPGVVDELLEVVVAPFGGVGGPGTLEAGGVGVLALAGAATTGPGVGGVLLGGGARAERASSVGLTES